MNRLTAQEVYFGPIYTNKIFYLFSTTGPGPDILYTCERCQCCLFKINEIEPINLNDYNYTDDIYRYLIKAGCYICLRAVSGTMKEYSPAFSIVKQITI